MTLKTNIKILSAILITASLALGSWFIFSNNDLSAKADASSIVSEGYLPYDAGKLTNGKTSVLFFKTNWCSTCTGLYQDIQENLASIPDDIQILEVDYDTNYSLKNYYNIRVQHTLVQVDADGKAVKTWYGSPTLENLLSQVQS